jgi:hypothetical protein
MSHSIRNNNGHLTIFVQIYRQRFKKMEVTSHFFARLSPGFIAAEQRHAIVR